MKHRYYLVLTLFSLILSACSDSDQLNLDQEGDIIQDEYVSQEIGWRMPLPDNFEVIDHQRVEEMNSRGRDAMEQASNQSFDFSTLKNLLSLKQDQFNTFLSTSEKFDTSVGYSWEENNELVRQLIIDTYQNQGINADVSELRTEQIDGLDFRLIEIDLYGPDGGLVMNQLMYSRLINGYDFGVNINSTNDDSKRELMEAFRRSTFSSRE